MLASYSDFQRDAPSRKFLHGLTFACGKELFLLEIGSNQLPEGERMNLSLLRSREVALVADFLGDLYQRPPGRFADHVVALCMRHLGDFANTAVFDETELRTGAYAAACNRMEELAPHLPALGAHIHEHPGWAYAAAGGDERVLLVSDFYSLREWKNTALYGCGFRQMKTPHQLAVSLPTPTHICGLALNDERKMPEEFRVLMHLLAPHIARAHQHWWQSQSHPARHLGLSPREGEVLHWIAEGKRDAEIATILGIAPRSVSKHVEHILAKLGAETRTAAAALAGEAARREGGRGN